MAWHDGPKERNNPRVDAYINDLEPAQRHIVTQIRLTVTNFPDVVETIAWGVPFWFWTRPNGHEEPLCYASAAKKHVTFGVARGAEINDTSGLLTGTGKSPIRKATLLLDKPIPQKAITHWLRAARHLPEE